MKKPLVDNCTYNCIKQLSKKLCLLWNIDRYIADAKDCNHKECIKLFNLIKKDSEKHAKILKNIIKKKAAKWR